MDTLKFKTKTNFINRDNGRIPGVWPIAMDVGYSSVKLFSPNCIASFPSYARRIDEKFHFIAAAPEESIIYKNMDNGEMYLVGEVAQDTMATGDTSNSEASLYGRDRYYTTNFQVISSVGLGLAMLENEYGAPDMVNDRLVLQTGLPEKYMDDEPDLIEALAKDYNFALKIGTGDWKYFKFSINTDNVFVMSQPKGTLFSVCINRNGQFHSEAEKRLTSSVLVFDPGFGTLDLFPIIKGTVGIGETWADLGMKRVFQKTCRSIKDKYGVNIEVPEIQKYLETGLVKSGNRRKIESCEYSFSKLLEEANESICTEAVERMLSAINIVDYNYFIITGGTGAAWENILREKFRKLETLTILTGNQNDNLPMIYSNVRGYYYYRYNKLLA